MDETKSSPKKASRTLTAHYSACLLHDATSSEKLQGLIIALCNPGQFERHEHSTEIDTAAHHQEHHLPEKLVVPDVMACSCCQVSFTDRDDQLSHYKSDWHRYNLHRRLRGQTFVTEEKFEEIAGDVSSISGSDEDDDEMDDGPRESNDVTSQQASVSSQMSGSSAKERKFHKVYFNNTHGELVSVYRCLLHHKKVPMTDPAELVKAAAQLPRQTKWVILMISAGHFAGAVFQGKQVVEHKTFHRYTVRAKRGTAQSSRDKQGNAPKSAGARLRRYNEAALSQEVQELMAAWSEHFATSNLIFVRIPTSNRAMFYGGKNPILKKDDQRIRIIPFATRRPTFSETKRVYQMLASVECYGSEADVGDIVPLSPPRFYSAETDQLEIREPREPKPKAKPSKPESERAHKQESAPSFQQTKGPQEEVHDVESSSETESVVIDVQLVEHVQTRDFSHLCQFDCTIKRKRGKKKKEQTRDTLTVESKPPGLDEDTIRWRNKLFTACKTADVEALLSTVNAIREQQADHEKQQTGCALNSSAAEDERQSTQISGASSSQSPDPDSTSATQKGGAEKLNGVTSENLDKVSSTSPKHSSCGLDTRQSSDVLADILNSPVGDSKMTFLHLAAREGHAEIITALLASGADPAIKDGTGKLPYNNGETEVRNAFRRFMATFPTRYDYTKAQVPSPLTAEMEQEKKIKMAEKRKQKKKAAQERNKEKKAIEAQARAENQEKDRFLALSDREKRALAAERRILQQRNEQGMANPVLSRCFQCATDITGKVPFEYSNFKFCTTKCLREHRSKAAS